MSKKQKVNPLRKELDQLANKCFSRSESLEDLLNQKLRSAELSGYDSRHLSDLQKVIDLLIRIEMLLRK